MDSSIPISLQLGYNSSDVVCDAYILEVTRAYNVRDLYHTFVKLEMAYNLVDFIDRIEKVVGDSFVKMSVLSGHVVLEFPKFVMHFSNFFAPSESKRGIVAIDLDGPIGLILDTQNRLQAAFPINKSGSLTWCFEVNGGVSQIPAQLSHNHTVHDSFFPWIKSGVAQFQKEFLESNANILLMIGTPGSGKTSFIRDMIHRNGLSARVTYDEKLMTMDQFFINFITGYDDVLIIEDVDVLLRDRAAGNRAMNKLLNTGNGLVQTHKKIVMTANLTHLDEVDSALIRPGRCFEALIFRELSHKEAVIAAADAGLAEPDGSRTLAELFNTGPSEKVISRLGFGFS